jgi:heptosyltransferase-2
MDLHRILVIRTGALGDFVLTLPVLGALREAYPRAHLYLAGRPEIASLAGDNITRVFDISDAAWAPFFSQGGRLPKQLTDPLRSTDLVLCYLPDEDGVFAGNLRRAGAGRVVTASPHPPGDGSRHAIDHLLSPLVDLGIPSPTCPVPRVVPDDSDRLEAEDIANAHGLDADPSLVLHAGSGGESKRWHPEGFAAVADIVSRWSDRTVVVLEGPAEPGLAKKVAGLMSTQPRVLPPLPLRALAALLSRAHLYLGNDSGPSHLAAAVGAPSVVLFGPTNPRTWAPRGPVVRIVQGDPDLPPVERLNSVSVADVIQAVEGLR